jgi:hypothetical protein
LDQLVYERFPYRTLLTSMFVYGGLLRIGSNLLSLFNFGNTVEERLGDYGGRTRADLREVPQRAGAAASAQSRTEKFASAIVVDLRTYARRAG